MATIWDKIDLLGPSKKIYIGWDVSSTVPRKEAPMLRLSLKKSMEWSISRAISIPIKIYERRFGVFPTAEVLRLIITETKIEAKHQFTIKEIEVEDL